MRILLISAVPPPFGGIARWSENYYTYFGMDNEIETVDTSLCGNQNGSKIAIAIGQIIRTFRILGSLSKKLRKKFDIAHINSSCTSVGIIRDYFCARKLFNKSIPFVFHCHCNISDQLGTSKISRWFLSKMLDMAECIYVLNKSSEDFCRAFAKEKIKLCPNSISEEMIADKHYIQDTISTAVFVGHLYKTKGIEAVIATSKKYPNITFRVIGKYTDCYNEKCNTKNLLFVGEKSQEEVVAELDNADLFIFPSHTEGFSIALLEAMARGVPIVATDVGANRDMLCDKGGMILDVISNDAINLSDILDCKIRQEMSDWSIKKVMENYTHSKVFNMINNDYISILKAK